MLHAQKASFKQFLEIVVGSLFCSSFYNVAICLNLGKEEKPIVPQKTPKNCFKMILFLLG